MAAKVAGRPLVGHLIAFRRDRLELFESCIAAPDDVIELRIRTPAYLLKRAEDVRHVFVDRGGAYAKDRRNVDPRATRIFGYGLMTSTGASHRRMRRRIQPVFKREPLASVAAGVVREVDDMVDRWDADRPIDLADEMASFALDALMGSIFGAESEGELAVLEEGILARRHSMTRGLSAPTPLPAVLPMALRPRRRRAIRRLDEAIDRHIQARSEGGGGGGDLLSLVMSAHDEDPVPADQRQLHDHAVTFALAAFENVARALTWTIIAIAQRPEVDARIREEVCATLGDRSPAADDCADLRFTRMTLAESLRLWPPNALLSRVARRDDVLPTGKRIRAGAKILLSPYVVHRDAEYYPDPLRFDPERFSEEGSRERPPFAYFPFGGGPRVCIGRALATQQCTLVLARLAQRVRLELSHEPASYVCGCLPSGFGPAMRVIPIASASARTA